MSFCIDCIAEKNGRLLSEAEARIHRDNYPTHEIVAANEEPIDELV